MAGPFGLSTLSLLVQAFSDAARKLPGGSACNWRLLLSEGKVNYADGSVIHPGSGVSLGVRGGLELPLSPSLGLRALDSLAELFSEESKEVRSRSDVAHGQDLRSKIKL